MENDRYENHLVNFCRELWVQIVFHFAHSIWTIIEIQRLQTPQGDCVWGRVRQGLIQQSFNIGSYAPKISIAPDVCLHCKNNTQPVCVWVMGQRWSLPEERLKRIGRYNQRVTLMDSTYARNTSDYLKPFIIRSSLGHILE